MKKETESKKLKRGGVRQGAGRPRVDEPRKTRGFRLTDAEYIKVKQYIDTIR